MNAAIHSHGAGLMQVMRTLCPFLLTHHAALFDLLNYQLHRARPQI